MRNTIQLLFFLVITFASTAARAQDAQDYVVTLHGDTIKGDVRALAYGTELKVQITEPGKKKVVHPFYKVKSFSVNGEVLQPIKGPNGYAFMKPIKVGYLSLYSFQSENQTSYDGMFLLKRDGTGIEVPNLTFKKAMRNFLDDCPEIATKIENDVFNKRDLNKIIDEYNACIEGRPVKQSVATAKPAQPAKNVDAWDALENKVKAEPAFAEKENALEMISEIKTKVTGSQKIPNFLIEGLKASLPQETFKAELENALKQIN